MADTYIDTSEGKARYISGADILTPNIKVQDEPFNRIVIASGGTSPINIKFTGTPITIVVLDPDAVGFNSTPSIVSLAKGTLVTAQAQPSAVTTSEGQAFSFDITNFTSTEETAIQFVPAGSGNFYARVLLKVE